MLLIVRLLQPSICRFARSNLSSEQRRRGFTSQILDTPAQPFGTLVVLVS